MRIRSSKSRTSRQSHGLKFGMVGTYNTYFRNIKRKGKVIVDHSTTLRTKMTLLHLLMMMTMTVMITMTTMKMIMIMMMMSNEDDKQKVLIMMRMRWRILTTLFSYANQYDPLFTFLFCSLCMSVYNPNPSLTA